MDRVQSVIDEARADHASPSPPIKEEQDDHAWQKVAQILFPAGLSASQVEQLQLLAEEAPGTLAASFSQWAIRHASRRPPTPEEQGAEAVIHPSSPEGEEEEKEGGGEGKEDEEGEEGGGKEEEDGGEGGARDEEGRQQDGGMEGGETPREGAEGTVLVELDLEYQEGRRVVLPLTTASTAREEADKLAGRLHLPSDLHARLEALLSTHLAFLPPDGSEVQRRSDSLLAESRAGVRRGDVWFVARVFWFGGHRSARMNVRAGDTALRLAEDFCVTHDLPHDFIAPLSAQLANEMRIAAEEVGATARDWIHPDATSHTVSLPRAVPFPRPAEHERRLSLATPPGVEQPSEATSLGGGARGFVLELEYAENRWDRLRVAPDMTAEELADQFAAKHGLPRAMRDIVVRIIDDARKSPDGEKEDGGEPEKHGGKEPSGRTRARRRSLIHPEANERTQIPAPDEFELDVKAGGRTIPVRVRTTDDPAALAARIAEEHSLKQHLPALEEMVRTAQQQFLEGQGSR